VLSSSFFRVFSNCGVCSEVSGPVSCLFQSILLVILEVTLWIANGYFNELAVLIASIFTSEPLLCPKEDGLKSRVDFALTSTLVPISKRHLLAN
jgi:hypothetical protein